MESFEETLSVCVIKWEIPKVESQDEQFEIPRKRYGSHLSKSHENSQGDHTVGRMLILEVANPGSNLHNAYGFLSIARSDS